MLMAVSSSGAVTITGEISGSDAANALLLSGTGSVGFTTTSSFLAVSSSQQQVSASYIALSASYNTFSGSASTRITVDSASLLQVSSSQQQISSSLLQVSASYTALSGSYNNFSGSASTRITVDSASLLQVSSSQQQISASLLNVISIFATTGSNSFRANQSITGSLVVSSTITAQTLVVQTVTSSIVYSSGSNIFGSALGDRQTFTGSVNITGSLALAGNITSNGTAVMLGTGTTNYLPKFTGTSTIGNSSIFNDGTTTFINTTSGSVPPSLFVLQNAGANPHIRGISLYNQSSVGDGTEYISISHLEALKGQIQVGNATVAGSLLLNPLGGFVGINCTDPKYTLDVNGLVNINAQATNCQGTVQSLRISSNIGDAAVTINACSLLNYAYLAFAQNCVGKFEIGFSSCTDTTSPSTFYLNPNVQKGACGSAVFIKSNGNVGIGNANTDSYNNYIVLQVSGSTGGIIQTSDGIVKTAMVSNSQSAGLMGTRTNHDLRIVSNDTERIRVTCGGNTCIYCQLSVGPVVVIGNQGGSDTTVLTGGSGQGSALRMNYAGGCYNNFLAGNGDNYFNCLLGKLNAAGGVKFGNGSSTLNYYEEGSWTPQLCAGATAFTMGGINGGKYVRIGNQVNVSGQLNWSAGSGSGQVRISGLPFTSSGTRSAGSIGAVSSGICFSSGYGTWLLVNDPGYSFIYIIQLSTTGQGYSHEPPVASSGVVYGFSLSYPIL